MSNICLDVDGVIADICAGINNELEIKRGMYNYDYTDWLISKYESSLTKEIFGSKVFWKNLKPFDDAWYVINNWWTLGHDIHLVTARLDPAGRKVLFEWLDDWRIQYNNVHFASMGEKIDVIRDLDPLFVVEDNPHEVALIKQGGYECFLRRAWYNSEYWEDYDTIGSLFDIE